MFFHSIDHFNISVLHYTASVIRTDFLIADFKIVLFSLLILLFLNDTFSDNSVYELHEKYQNTQSILSFNKSKH